MSTVNTAIIIGGGIAGLSLARVLRRQGISVSVFEQAPALKDGGVGLTLWSNGLNALRLIDETIVPDYFEQWQNSREFSLFK
jgi:2-polyprenyl-6-methoxyphenol hydroxylase-like FAD-dependent oxidoreductase